MIIDFNLHAVFYKINVINIYPLNVKAGFLFQVFNQIYLFIGVNIFDTLIFVNVIIDKPD